MTRSVGNEADRIAGLSKAVVGADCAKSESPFLIAQNRALSRHIRRRSVEIRLSGNSPLWSPQLAILAALTGLLAALLAALPWILRLLAGLLSTLAALLATLTGIVLLLLRIRILVTH